MLTPMQAKKPKCGKIAALIAITSVAIVAMRAIGGPNDGMAETSAGSVLTEGRAEAVTLDPAPVVSVGLYKNGMAIVTRRITPGTNAVAFVDADVRPSYGSFWQSEDSRITVKSTKMRVLRQEENAGFADGWAEAYAGLRAEVVFRCDAAVEQVLATAERIGAMRVQVSASGEATRVCTATGTIVGGASKSGGAPNPRMSYPPPTAVKMVMLRLAKGSMVAVPESRIVSVRAMAEDSGGVVRNAPVWKFEGASRPFNVQYLAAGACWTPSYRLELLGGKWTLAMSTEIYNDVADWRDVEVSLISGFPNLLYADVPSLIGGGVDFNAYCQAVCNAEDDTDWGWYRSGRNRRRGGVMSQSVMLNYAPANSSAAPPALVAESAGGGADMNYRNIGRLSLAKGECLSLPLGRSEIKARQVTEWNLEDGRDEWGHLRRRNDDEKPSAWDAVAFSNPFSFPMTTAPIEIVEDGRILGQAKVGWTNPGDEAMAKITKALSVGVQYVESASDAGGVKVFGDWEWRKENVKGEFSMRNFRSAPVTMRIKKKLTGEVVEWTEQPRKVHHLPACAWNANMEHELTWELVLAPGESRKFTLTYWLWVRR